jgi:hypothetical protein
VNAVEVSSRSIMGTLTHEQVLHYLETISPSHLISQVSPSLPTKLVGLGS